MRNLGGHIESEAEVKTLKAVQQRSALRVTSAYRTVSETAVLIIAGMIPIDIYAQQRRKIFQLKTSQSGHSEIETIKQESLTLWQERWNVASDGRWTAKLIPSITTWIDRKCGDVNYYITQMLTGHGYFRKYLCDVGKCDTPYCLYEESETTDTAEHTFFECVRWENNRQELEMTIGDITKDNLVEKMVQSESKWKAVAKYCERVLRTKKVDLDAASAVDQRRDLDAGQ